MPFLVAVVAPDMFLPIWRCCCFFLTKRDILLGCCIVVVSVVVVVVVAVIHIWRKAAAIARVLLLVDAIPIRQNCLCRFCYCCWELVVSKSILVVEILHKFATLLAI